MSYLLEILGRGLIPELSAAFQPMLGDGDARFTCELEEAHRRDPSDLAIVKALADRRLADRAYARAEALYRSLCAAAPENLAARIGLACALDGQGRTREALGSLREARALAPDDAAILFGIGYCCERTEAIDDAIAAYEEVVEIAPEQRNAHERLAAIAMHADDAATAIHHYEYLCWSEPGDLPAALSLATLYARAERHADAVRKYEYVVSLNPGRWEPPDDLAAIYEERGEFGKAAGILEDLSHQQPDKADLHVRLGDLLHQLEQHDRALCEYLEAWTLNPDHMEVAVKIGTVYLHRGECAEAARWFGRALEVNDQTVHALLGLAVCQMALGEVCEAEASLQGAAAAEPSSDALFSQIARLQLKVAAAREREAHLTSQGLLGASADITTPGEPESLRMVEPVIRAQAERLEQELDEHPDHADLHYRLGILRRQLGDLDGAIEAFRRALAINPRYVKALNRLGLALRDRGADDEAEEMFQEALRVVPDEIHLHYHLGLLFSDRNRFASAVEHFQRACDLCPDEVEFHAHLALALQNMGLIDRATAVWETLMALPARTSVGPSPG